MTDTTDHPNNLLAENIHFHFVRASDGKDIRLTPQGVQFYGAFTRHRQLDRCQRLRRIEDGCERGP
jgi:hypothetical protein